MEQTTRIDHRDVQALVDAKRCSPFVLRKAAQRLRCSGEHETAAELELYLMEIGAIRIDRKPTPGDRRKFKIQKGAGETLFVRVPTNNAFPSHEAGDSVTASFHSGAINLSIADAGGE